MDYIFTLKYQLSEQDCDKDALVERLGIAGCDDALIGIGQPGRIALEFTREGASAEAALVSAMKAVKAAVPSARLIEASPDLVGLTDVAEILGVSRQNMRKLMVGHSTSFPAPMHDGTTVLWHLAEILQWLQNRGAYVLEGGILDVAETAMQINRAKEARGLSLRVKREVQALLQP